MQSASLITPNQMCQKTVRTKHSISQICTHAVAAALEHVFETTPACATTAELLLQVTAAVATAAAAAAAATATATAAAASAAAAAAAIYHIVITLPVPVRAVATACALVNAVAKQVVLL
jgi:hypothetical protein